MHTINARHLMEAVERARHLTEETVPVRDELEDEARRCHLRFINIPGERGMLRREHVRATCLEGLRAVYPELDVGFTDGIIARELHWTPHNNSPHRHRVQTTELNGRVYVADEEVWHPPTQNEADHMLRTFSQAGWNMSIWKAFLQDCSEPNSWGYVGCQLAHVEAWRAAHSAGVDWLLICEDDVCPIPLFDMDWVDVWSVVACEVRELRSKGERWDLLFVGKGSSVSPEGRYVTPLVVECGYNIKMHCYCISYEGMSKLLASELPFCSIRPQDEILASLNVQGRHPRERIRQKIDELFPAVGGFRSLCFPWWGIVFQLQHFEHHRNSEICRSAIGELGQEAEKQGF